MIIEMRGAQLFIHDGWLSIISDAPHECVECHRVTHFFENRLGRTRCIVCTMEMERETV